MEYWERMERYARAKSAAGAKRDRLQEQFEYLKELLVYLENCCEKFCFLMRNVMGVNMEQDALISCGQSILDDFKRRLSSNDCRSGVVAVMQELLDKIGETKQKIVEAMLPKLTKQAEFFIRRYTNNLPPEMVEDLKAELVSEGCIGVIEKAHQVLPSRFNIYECFTFLSRAAAFTMKKYIENEKKFVLHHNQPYTLLPSNKRGSDKEVDELAIFDKLPDDSMCVDDELSQRTCLLAFVDELAEVERYVFVSHIAGYSDMEIAGNLGISPAQVRKCKKNIYSRVIREEHR